MIVLTIALTIAGGVIAALAIIAAFALQANSRLRSFQAAERSATDVARASVKKLQAEVSTLQQENTDLAETLESVRALYNKILRERQELVARNTAMVEAMEARPTQPKRTVRKNSTQSTEQEGA